MHTFFGLFSLLSFVVATYLTFWASGWTFGNSFHCKFGLSGVILGSLLFIGGIVSTIVKYRIPMEWNTKKKLKISSFHGYFGYLFILISQFIVYSGIYNFYNYLDELSTAYLIMGLNIGGFILLLLLGEVCYRVNRAKHVPFKKLDKKMSPELFEK